MPLENSEVRNFLDKSDRFTKLFPHYKKFVNLVDFIISLLAPEQLKILEFEYKGETIDFKTQLLIYFEDRYSLKIEEQQIRERIQKAISEYQFLFEAKLDKNKIRSILLRVIMDLVTVGSQCFFYRKNSVGWHKYSRWEWKTETEGVISRIKDEIFDKYINLPFREEVINFWKCRVIFVEELFINRYEAVFENQELEEIWVSEFFKRTEWFFKKLNTCKEEYRNKYRERILQETNLFIGEDRNATHSFSKNILWIYQPKVKNIFVESNVNKHIEEVVSEILNCLGEDITNELQEDNSWDFKEQLLQRYYSRYPSFVSLEEIKEYIRQKCSEYKSLLIGENKQLMKEIFMDELDQELFVSQNTHVWNQEMLKNLSESNANKAFFGVKWAIGQIISFLNPEGSKALNVTIEGKEYDLQTILAARWKRSILARSKKVFLQKLLELKIQTSYNFLDSNPINLQIFLERIDSCFLYPRKGRSIKILLRKDDTGDLLKTRKNISYLLNEINKFRLVIYKNFIPITLAFIAAVWFCCLIGHVYSIFVGLLFSAIVMLYFNLFSW